jgi:hypothetical protein
MQPTEHGNHSSKHSYQHSAHTVTLMTARTFLPLLRWLTLLQGLAGAVNFWLDVVDHQHSKWPGAEL